MRLRRLMHRQYVGDVAANVTARDKIEGNLEFSACGCVSADDLEFFNDHKTGIQASIGSIEIADYYKTSCGRQTLERLGEGLCADDLDREIEYAFDTDEPMLGRPPAGDVE